MMTGVKSFIAALRFLTIAPIPARWANEAEYLSRSVPLFPIVGLLIGAAIVTADFGMNLLFPSLLANGITVVALVAVSGGLHIDGLADTADGFFSSRPRERILEIMRDSRTGPMGVVAVMCVLMLKFAAVASVGADTRWQTILMMPFAGRCALAISILLLPYARPEGGLVEVLRTKRSWLHLVRVIAVLVIVGVLIAGYRGLAMAGVSLIGTLLFASYTYTKIGGMTGDTLGATCEIVELIPPLVAAASISVS